MTIFGEKFVYGEINLTEYQLRLVRCRAEAALRERELARKFAASKKALKKRVQEDPLPEDSNVELANINVGSANTYVEPSNTNVEPTNTNIEPTNTYVEPSNTNVELTNTNVEPTNTNIEPANNNVGPANTNVEPANTDIEPANTNDGPANTNTTDGVDAVSVHYEDSPVRDKLPQSSRATTERVWRHYRVPRGFMNWLLGPDRIHLDNLGAWYHVRTTLDPKRRMVHLGGSVDNVLEAYAAVKTLVTAWRAWEATQ